MNGKLNRRRLFLELFKKGVSAAKSCRRHSYYFVIQDNRRSQVGWVLILCQRLLVVSTSLSPADLDESALTVGPKVIVLPWF